jgi:hypothetical protein
VQVRADFASYWIKTLVGADFCPCSLDIANIGPEELVDAPAKKLWLSDLKAYREEDWEGSNDNKDGAMEDSWIVVEESGQEKMDGKQDLKEGDAVNSHGRGSNVTQGVGPQRPSPRKGEKAPRKLLGGSSAAD